MKKLFAMLATVAMLAAPAAMAEDYDMYDGDASLCEYCWDKGSFTEDNPTASRVLLFPVRAVTAGVGAPLGALKGMGSSTVNAVDIVNEATFQRAKEEPGMSPILVPAGLIGTVIALPLGVAHGAITGTLTGLAKGYMYPDTF